MLVHVTHDPAILPALTARQGLLEAKTTAYPTSSVLPAIASRVHSVVLQQHKRPLARVEGVSVWLHEIAMLLDRLWGMREAESSKTS